MVGVIGVERGVECGVYERRSEATTTSRSTCTACTALPCLGHAMRQLMGPCGVRPWGGLSNDDIPWRCPAFQSDVCTIAALAASGHPQPPSAAQPSFSTRPAQSRRAIIRLLRVHVL